MIENYLNYRDVVFIHRRFTKSRFSKPIILFCGVNNQGRNVLFGLCVLTREDEDGLRYMIEHF